MQKISWMMACLVLLVLPCQAASWREVATAPASGATVSVDTASLDSREYIASGWIRVDYPEPREKSGYLLNGYSAKWQTNCKDRTYWVSDAWGYRPDAADAVRLYSANQRWLTPDEKTLVAPLPAGIQGRFAPELHRFVLLQHHQGRVTAERIRMLLNSVGVAGM